MSFNNNINNNIFNINNNAYNSNNNNYNPNNNNYNPNNNNYNPNNNNYNPNNNNYNPNNNNYVINYPNNTNIINNENNNLIFNTAHNNHENFAYNIINNNYSNLIHQSNDNNQNTLPYNYSNNYYNQINLPSNYNIQNNFVNNHINTDDIRNRINYVVNNTNNINSAYTTHNNINKIQVGNLLNETMLDTYKIYEPQSLEELKRNFFTAFSQGHPESDQLLERILKEPQRLIEIDPSTGSHLVMGILRLESPKATLQVKVKNSIKIIEKWDAFARGKSSYLHLFEYPNIHNETLLSNISSETLTEFENQNPQIKNKIMELTISYHMDSHIESLNKGFITDIKNIQEILDAVLSNYINVSVKILDEAAIRDPRTHSMLIYLHTYTKAMFESAVIIEKKIDLFVSIYRFFHCCNSPSNEEWSRLRKSFVQIDNLFSLIKNLLGSKKFNKRLGNVDLNSFLIIFIKSIEKNLTHLNTPIIINDLMVNLGTDSTLNNFKSILLKQEKSFTISSNKFREKINLAFQNNKLKKPTGNENTEKIFFEYYSETINWVELSKSLYALFNTKESRDQISLTGSLAMLKLIGKVQNINTKTNAYYQNAHQFSLLTILTRLMNANLEENKDPSPRVTSMKRQRQPNRLNTPRSLVVPIQPSFQQIAKEIPILIQGIHTSWVQKGVVDRLKFLLKLAEGKCQFDLTLLKNKRGYDIQFLKSLLNPIYELFNNKSTDQDSIEQSIAYALKICRYCANNNDSELTVFKENLLIIYPEDPNFVEFIAKALSNNLMMTTLTPIQFDDTDINILEGVCKAFIYFTVSDMRFHVLNSKQIHEPITNTSESVREIIKPGSYFFCKENGEVIIAPLVFSLSSGSRIQAVVKDNGTIRKILIDKMQLHDDQGPIVLPKSKIQTFNDFCIHEKKGFISLTEISNSVLETAFKPIEISQPNHQQRENIPLEEFEKKKRRLQPNEIFSDVTAKKTLEKSKAPTQKTAITSEKTKHLADTSAINARTSQSFSGFGAHSSSSLKRASKGTSSSEPIDIDLELEVTEESLKSLETSNKKIKQSHSIEYINQPDQILSKETPKGKTSSENISGLEIVMLPHHSLNEINLGEGTNFYESLLLKTQTYALNKLRDYTHYLKFNKAETLFERTHSLTKVLHVCANHQMAPITMFDTKLKPYQKETVEKSIGLFLQKLGLVIASDPGLGKTRQAIEIVMQVQIKDEKGEPVLVIVPKAILSQWKNEIQKRCFKTRRKYYKSLLIDSRGINESQKNEFVQKFIQFFIQHMTMDDPNGNIKKRNTHLQKLFMIALRSFQFSSLMIKALIDIQRSTPFITHEKKPAVIKSLSNCLKEFLIGCEDKFTQTEALDDHYFSSFKQSVQNPQLTLEEFTNHLAGLIINSSKITPEHIKSLISYIENLKPQYTQSQHSQVSPPWIPALITPNMYDQVIVLSKDSPVKEAELKEKLKENQWTFIITNKESIIAKTNKKESNVNNNSLNHTNKHPDNGKNVTNEILRSTPFSLVIWDEAQEVTRNYNTLDAKKQKANAGLEFFNHVHHTYGTKLLALSGTPMPNIYNQTLSLIELVNPGSKMVEMVKLLVERDQTARKHLLEVMKTPTRPLGQTINSLLLSYLTYEHFKFIQKQLVFVHAKDDNAIIQQWTELDKNMNPICNIPSVKREELEYDMNEVLKNKIKSDLPKMKEKPIKYKASFEVELFHPELLKDGKILEDSEIRTKINNLCESKEDLEAFINRSDLLKRFLNGNEFKGIIADKTPCLIFLNYIQPAEALKKIIVNKFQLKADEVSCYHSDMNPEDREKVKNKFEKNGGVLILTGKAGGVGLNLKKAKALFNLAPWWNDAYETQLEARAVRAGVSGTVNIYKFNGHSAAENYYRSIQERKKAWTQWILKKDDYKTFIKLLIEDLAAGINIEISDDHVLDTIVEASQSSLNSEEFKKQLALSRSFYAFEKEKEKKFFPEDEFRVFPLLTFTEGESMGGREKAIRIGVDFMKNWNNESTQKSMENIQERIAASDTSIREMIRVGDWSGLEANHFSKDDLKLLLEIRNSDDQNNSITKYTHELYAFNPERKYQLLKSRVGGDETVRILKRVFSKNCIKYDLLLQR